MNRHVTLGWMWLVVLTVLAMTPIYAQERTDAAQADPVLILRTARATAIEQVLASSRSDDPFLRANALEAAQYLPDRVSTLIRLGMQDQSPAVRFAALAVAGKLKLKDIAPGAKAMLQDTSPSVQAAALFALKQAGQPADVSPLANMLTSQNPGVRGNAALLLGWLGDASAVPMLKDLAKAPMPKATAVQEAIVRIQVADAICRLGDDSSLDALRAGIYSQFDEVRILAVNILGEQGDKRFLNAMEELLNQNPIELQLAAAGAMARMGQPSGLPVVLKHAGSQQPTIRAQVAMTLGLFRQAQAARTLASMLNDSSEQVRIAAAAAILKAGASGQ